MPRSIPALVKPALLVWARDRSGLTLEQAAKKLQIDAAVLERWESESSEERPTIAQVRRLGEIYKRPASSLFLTGPPEGF